MLLDEMASWLEGQGVGILAQTIFLSYLPDDPDALLVIYETGGPPPDDTFGELAAIERPRFQLIARDTSYVAARTLIGSAWEALASIQDATIGGVHYLRVAALASPAQLRRDDRQREILFCNFQADRQLP